MTGEIEEPNTEILLEKNRTRGTAMRENRGGVGGGLGWKSIAVASKTPRVRYFIETAEKYRT